MDKIVVNLSERKDSKNKMYQQGYRDALDEVVMYLSGFFSTFSGIPKDTVKHILDEIQKGWL